MGLLFAIRKNTKKVIDYINPPLRTMENLNAVFLTFDDGPDDISTREIISVLSENKSTATFFVIGRQIQKHPGILRELDKGGHTIGSHSDAHLKAWEENFFKVFYDLLKGHFRLCWEMKKYYRYFRPPYGYYGASARLFALLTGCKAVLWSCDSFDWKTNSSADSIVKTVDSNLSAGEILLLHDYIYDNELNRDRSETVRGLRQILAILNETNLIATSVGKRKMGG